MRNLFNKAILRRSSSWKTIFLLFMLMLIVLPTQVAKAQGFTPRESVPAGETVQDSVFLSGANITIDGIVDGDVLAVGRNIVLNGEIKGNLFILGRWATINGKIGQNLYAVTARLMLESNAYIGGSVYGASGLVKSNPDSQVEEDVVLVGLGGQPPVQVGRIQKVHLGLLELYDWLFGKKGLFPLIGTGFKFSSNEIAYMPDQPSQNILQSSSSFTGFKMTLTALGMALHPETQQTAINTVALGNWLMVLLRTLIPLLLIGLLMLWLFPRFIQGSTEKLRNHPWRSLGIGVVALYVSIGVAIIALILVVAVGWFFGFLDLWGLAGISWAFGAGSLSLVVTFLFLAIMYLSKIFVAYLLGMLLLGWTATTTWGRRVWMLLLGEAILVLVLSIPILGWVISLVVALFGLGAIYMQLRQRKQTRSAVEQTPVVSDVDETVESKTQIETAAPVQSEIVVEPESEKQNINEMDTPVESSTDYDSVPVSEPIKPA